MGIYVRFGTCDKCSDSHSTEAIWRLAFWGAQRELSRLLCVKDGGPCDHFNLRPSLPREARSPSLDQPLTPGTTGLRLGYFKWPIFLSTSDTALLYFSPQLASNDVV